MAGEWDKHGQIIANTGQPPVVVIDGTDGSGDSYVSGGGAGGGGGGIAINNHDTFFWSIPPFLMKLYDMLENRETDSLVSWSSGGNSFVIKDPHLFAINVLPLYFKHRIFHNFICQLNSYGFKKVSWGKWEYRNENFRKGERSLLRNIKRRTSANKQITGLPQSSSSPINPQGNSVNSSSSSTGKSEKEVELMLMKEQDLLSEEIAKLKEKQDALEKRLASLSKTNIDHHNRVIRVLRELIRDTVTIDEGETEISKGKRKLEEIESKSAAIDVGSEDLMNGAGKLIWDIDEEEEEMGEHHSNTLISLKDLIGESSDCFQHFLREMQDKPKTPT